MMVTGSLDFNSATIELEALTGGKFKATDSKWGLVSVDDFTIYTKGGLRDVPVGSINIPALGMLNCSLCIGGYPPPPGYFFFRGIERRKFFFPGLFC